MTDPNAGYVNGNPQTGIQGSIPPAASIEYPQREIVNLINSSNILPDDADLFQLTKGTRSQWMNFATDVGSVNALVVALVPALTSYTVGLPLRVRVLHDNLVDATHTSMTLDAGAGAAPIRKMDGSSPGNAEIRAGALIEVAWDGTAWQLVNFGGAGGAGTVNYLNVNIPYVVDSGTKNHIVGPFSPAITVLNVGAVLLVKIANSVDDVTDFKVNALPPHPVKAPDGSDLLPGDIVAGDVVEFVFDGTNFYIRPNPAISVNCTFNVPSTRFPTVASVMAAITRKTIAPTATVTIQLATGIYPPFSIYHQNADQIVIKGTMLIAGMPVIGNFSVTGAGSLADSNNNIFMLRSRYGTEVQVGQSNIGNGVQGYGAGIINLGPGKPLIRDMLITGDNTNSGAHSYRLCAILVSNRSIATANVATWGCTEGFSCMNGGNIDMIDTCFAVANWISNIGAWQGSQIRVNRGVICIGSPTGNGASASGSSVIYVVPGGQVQTGPGGTIPKSYFSANNGVGVGIGQGSSGGIYGVNAFGNGILDMEAAVGGVLYSDGSSYATYSPSPNNTEGNYWSAVFWTPDVPPSFV